MTAAAVAALLAHFIFSHQTVQSTVDCQRNPFSKMDQSCQFPTSQNGDQGQLKSFFATLDNSNIRVIDSPNGKEAVVVSCDVITQVEHEGDISQIQTTVKRMKFTPNPREAQLLALTSLRLADFKFLLDMLATYRPPPNTKKSDLLLAFLMKLKFNLPFASLAVIFHIKKKIIQSEFRTILEITWF